MLQIKRRPRIYYSDSQKALMWARWKQGWPLHEIGKLFDRPHTSIHRILAETGGFQPAQRSRASKRLATGRSYNLRSIRRSSPASVRVLRRLVHRVTAAQRGEVGRHPDAAGCGSEQHRADSGLEIGHVRYLHIFFGLMTS